MPKDTRLRGVRVLVAGAGLAGLSAASALERLGADVSVIDARDRVGGRVWTRRDGLTSRQHAEMGADIIEPNQEPVIELARMLGLRLVPVLKDGFSYFGPTASGRLAVQSLAATFQSVARDLDPLIAAYRLAEHRWDTSVAEALARVSLASWLKGRTTPAAIRERFRGLRGLFLADPDDLSLLAMVDFLAGDPFNGADHMLRTHGGNDRLATALAGSLRRSPALRRTLRRVSQTEKTITATLEGAGRTSEWTGDYLVSALPASTLRDVVFTPALPPTQQRAIATLRYGPATRVLLQFERAFWRRRGQPRAFGTNQPFGAVWDANEEQRGRAGILSCLAGGNASSETCDLLDRDGADGLVKRLAWLGPPSRLVSSSVFRWEDDEWARGGYAYFDPGFDPRDRSALSHQAGRVCFAGEHTSFKWQGYMSGAIESGRRAAAEITLTHVPLA